MFALTMGLISYAYNKDYESVKTTLRWVVRLSCGGSDSEEAERIVKQKLEFAKLKEHEELEVAKAKATEISD